MTSATPKPRAGEPSTLTASEQVIADHTAWVRAIITERDLLRERERELVEALTYCEISTRADGQWADQSVHTFLLSVLSKHGR